MAEELHPFDAWLDANWPAWRAKNQGSAHYYAMKVAWIEGAKSARPEAGRLAKAEALLREANAIVACTLSADGSTADLYEKIYGFLNSHEPHSDRQ